MWGPRCGDVSDGRMQKANDDFFYLIGGIRKYTSVGSSVNQLLSSLMYTRIDKHANIHIQRVATDMY